MAGSWAATAVVEVDGVRRRIGRTGRSKEAATEAVQTALRALEVEPEVGELPEAPPVVVTVADVARSWVTHTLPTRSKSSAASTRALYAGTVERDLIPPLGAIPVGELTATDVEALLGAHAEHSAATRRRILSVLRFVLDTAVRDGHARVNVARLVERPAEDPPNPKAYAPGELEKLLEAASGDRVEPVITLMAWTGLRIGEALGLAASDVVLEGAPRVWVRGSLSRVPGGGLVLTAGKSRKAQRWVPLAPEAVSAVKRWRAIQAAERLAAGPFWRESDYLFTSSAGTSMDPHNVRSRFYAIAKRAGVGGSPHVLRHTMATDMLANGVSVRDAQEILGHASPVVTMATYQRVTAAGQASAVERVRQARRSS
jgi:integrase